MNFYDVLLAKKLNGGGGSPIDLQTLTVTENGEQDAPSGVAYNKVITNVPAPANALFKQTLTGLPSPIATFTGADAPLDSLKASIVGTQDLHGYDSPWPACGGKNKLPMTVSGIKSVNTSGTWSESKYTESGVTFSIETDNGGNVTGIRVNGTATANVYFYVAKNLTFGTFDGSYIVNGGVNGGGDSTFALQVYSDISGLFMNVYNTNDVILYMNNHSSAQIERVCITIRNGYTANNLLFKPMIRLSTVADPTFAPYSNICPISGWTSCEVTDNNDTYTIPFKDSSDNPITVYDGAIDVTGGSAEFDKPVIDLGGLNWSQEPTGMSGKYRFKADLTGAKQADTSNLTSICSQYVLVAQGATYSLNEGYTINNNVIYLYDSAKDTMSSADFKASMVGVKLAYELTTPIDNTFTPISLRSNGLTNISVDCGEVTECKYYSETP